MTVGRFGNPRAPQPVLRARGKIEHPTGGRIRNLGPSGELNSLGGPALPHARKPNKRVLEGRFQAVPTVRIHFPPAASLQTFGSATLPRSEPPRKEPSTGKAPGNLSSVQRQVGGFSSQGHQ